MKIKLVEITEAELPQIQAIDRACLNGFWSLAAYAEEIARPNSHLLAIMSGGAVLGFGCLWTVKEEAHITMLAVRPEYQRQGLGRYLVWGLLSIACTQGLEWATLEVRVSNQGAIALYQGFDFEIIGKRPKYYPVTEEDALVLWRKGLHLPEFPSTLAVWHRDIERAIALNNWEIRKNH
jgi:[ribosomal protein S18]-alanine N-acetyltransferase